MREVRGRNYSHTRVGSERVDRAIVPVRPYYVVVAEWVAGPADALMGLTPGVAYRRTRFPGYPLVVAEDTAFIDCKFAQAGTHTDGVFDVKPGVRLVFGEPDEDKAATPRADGSWPRGDCTLVNLKIPDEANVLGGNSIHRVPFATGDRDKPFIGLLCECLKCCTYRGQLLAEMPRDRGGRVLHDAVWELAVQRRRDPAKVAADREVARLSNESAVAKYGRTVTAALRTSLKRGA